MRARTVVSVAVLAVAVTVVSGCSRCGENATSPIRPIGAVPKGARVVCERCMRGAADRVHEAYQQGVSDGVADSRGDYPVGCPCGKCQKKRDEREPDAE